MCGVNGTVEKDESYVENIIHEIEEEVGLQVNKGDFSFSKKVFSDGHGKRTKFVMYFVLEWNVDIANLTPDPDEIDEMK